MSRDFSPPDHRLLVVASLTGMAAVLTLPMSAVAVAFGLLVLVAVALGPGPDLLAVVPTAIVLIGPLAAVGAVGAPLRDADVVAAALLRLRG